MLYISSLFIFVIEHFQGAMDPQLDIDPIQEDDSAFLISQNSQKEHNQQWPFIFWIYLKSLGLYHSGKKIGIFASPLLSRLNRLSCVMAKTVLTLQITRQIV